MLGYNKGHVKLVPHSADWKALFETERKLLEALIGKHVEEIQHFGSTAINGIKTKPVIDILLGVSSMAKADRFNRDKLVEHSYYHLPKVKIEGKAVFAKVTNMEKVTKTHILHVVQYGGSWWHEHLFFRDYLNKHPEAAKAYEQLKEQLAAEYVKDEKSYTDQKKAFVDEVLAYRTL